MVWFAVGALIFWRRSDDRMALLVSHVSGVLRAGYGRFHGCRSLGLLPASLVVARPGRGRSWVTVCAVLFFLLFPGGRFAAALDALARGCVLRFSMFPDILFPDLYSRSPALEMISFLVFLGIVVSLVWSQIYRYRRVSSPAATSADQVGRLRRGPGCRGKLPLPAAGGPPLDWRRHTYCVYSSSDIGFTVSFLLIPLSISVAVLRSHLFDIDVLINRTLVYGALTVMLVAPLLRRRRGVAAALRRRSRARASTLAIVASTLAIAALFNPLRRRIQSFIDQALLPQEV